MLLVIESIDNNNNNGTKVFLLDILHFEIKKLPRDLLK